MILKNLEHTPARGLDLALGPEIIASLLPHRAPIVLVDCVERYRSRPRPGLDASLSVQGDEPVLAGHFPGRPIWPGAYMMEGIAQCAGLLLGILELHAAFGLAGLRSLSSHSHQDPEQLPTASRGKLGLLARAKIDLHAPVSPPARLGYRVELVGAFAELQRVDGSVVVEDRLVAQGSVSIILLNEDDESSEGTP